VTAEAAESAEINRIAFLLSEHCGFVFVGFYRESNPEQKIVSSDCADFTDKC
jgi:hypothetical protein